MALKGRQDACLLPPGPIPFSKLYQIRLQSTCQCTYCYIALDQRVTYCVAGCGGRSRSARGPISEVQAVTVLLHLLFVLATVLVAVAVTVLVAVVVAVEVAVVLVVVSVFVSLAVLFCIAECILESAYQGSGPCLQGLVIQGQSPTQSSTVTIHTPSSVQGVVAGA